MSTSNVYDRNGQFVPRSIRISKKNRNAFILQVSLAFVVALPVALLAWFMIVLVTV